MKKKDISILIDGFRRLSADAAEIAELLSGTETSSKKTTEVQAEPETPAPAAEDTPAKVYTFEEVRGILADKARSGFRAEVKALYTSHGVKQLSDISDQTVYADLSASSRWLACSPSAKQCAELEDQYSPYAQQGTDAHELCEYLVTTALGLDASAPAPHLSFYDEEMQEAADSYCSFVMEQFSAAKEHCSDPLICVEQRLDFSRWVKDGFSTGDCVIVADELLHIIDLKYGVGVLVTASGEDGTGNSQLKCYALGALDTLGALCDIRRIRLSIYQPRRDNVDTFEMSAGELLKWADEVLKPTAEPAYEGGGEFHAGDHCQFCKLKATCRARTEYSMELAIRGNSKFVQDLDALKTPLRDGDKERKGDPAYANSYFVNANSTTKSGVVDADRQDIIDTSELYSDIVGRASINFYAYNSNGNKGIACGLNNLQKLADGTPLGGHSRAEDDFADLDDEDDEDFLG